MFFFSSKSIHLIFFNSLQKQFDNNFVTPLSPDRREYTRPVGVRVRRGLVDQRKMVLFCKYANVNCLYEFVFVGYHHH